MSDTPDRPTEGGVLRPFVEPEHEALPDPDPPTAASIAPAPPPPAPEPPTGTDEPAIPDRLIGSPPADAAAVATDEESDLAAARAAVGLEDPSPDTAADAEPSLVLPDGSGAAETVTFGRKPFLIGLGAMIAALLLLIVLWQTAGGDDAVPTEVADVPAPVDSEGVEIDTTDTDALTAALAQQTERADGAEQRTTELETQVADLEARLAERPVPALPASALTRVIISADAQFVSATDVGVAVVGPFGGYANIDPGTDAVTASAQIGTESTRVLRTPTTVWATNFAGNELVRLDPVTNQIVSTFPFPGPDGLAKHGDTLMVASFSEGFVGQVDPRDGQLVNRVDVGGSATAVAVQDERIYAAVFETGEVVKLDPVTLQVLDRAIVGAGPVGLMIGANEKVWVTNRNEGTVARVDFATGEVISIPVGDGPVEVAAAFGSIWVAVADEGELVQISLEDQAIVTRTPLGGAPTGLSVGAGSLWVAIGGDQSVVRITL